MVSSFNKYRDSWIESDRMNWSSEQHGSASKWHDELTDKYDREMRADPSFSRKESLEEKRDYHASQTNFHDFSARGNSEMAAMYWQQLVDHRNPYTKKFYFSLGA